MGNSNDLALHKKVLEYCNHYHYLTSGKEIEYDNKSGYCATHWPAYLTVDLEREYDLRQISFQLWDYEDPNNKLADKAKYIDQIYAYRLLLSSDKRSWQVIHDTAGTSSKYRKGWQTFLFDNAIRARYIRVHAIHNMKNSGFHIVRLHAFEEINPFFDKGNVFICFDPYELELGDAYPLSNQLLDLSGRIQNAMPRTVSTMLKQRYTQIIDYLFEKSKELDAVDGKVDEVRKLIAEPISEKFEEEFKKNNRSEVVGLVISVVSLVIWIVIMIFKL